MVDVRALLQEKKVCIGRERCLKKLRLGEVKQVYIASNCPRREDVDRLAALSGAVVETLSANNKELGALCRKPFSVSVICTL